MTTVGSLLLTMRDNVPSADMPPVQVAIFGLQQSQQQCLSFFSDCIKYCEKHDMRREASGAMPTLEKLVMSQKVLVENLDPDKARAAIHSLRNVISPDEWSDNVGERGAVKLKLSRAGTDTTLPFGPDHRGTEDVMHSLRTLESPGYDPFRGMSLDELGKERQKWTMCRKFFENELRGHLL